MESQTQTTPNTLPTIQKLQPHTEYNFTECRMIHTKTAGNVYVVYDEMSQKRYWANGKLTKYIKDNFETDGTIFCRVALPIPQTYVQTGDLITYEKDGKRISYLDMKFEEDFLKDTPSIFSLDPSSNYTFVKAKKVDTKYGPTYILINNYGTKYHSTKRLNKYIEKNYTTEELEPNLIVHTLEKKSYEKDGKKIEYLDMKIEGDEPQPVKQPEEQKPKKLEEGQTYLFVKAKEIKTNYGPTYILTEFDGDKYYSTKRLNEYIKKRYTTEELQPNVCVNTYKFNTYEKKGEKHTYLEMDITRG